MNATSRKHSIARTVAAAALTLAALAGVTSTTLAASPAPGHVATQLVPPTRVLPPDPCRSAC
jgi:hypothetical protein